jgi:hypothetical protein
MIDMGLEHLFPEVKTYAVELTHKITDMFGLGTEELPPSLRAFLLTFFQKAYKDLPGARIFFHPEHSPIDDSSVIEIVDAVENSKKKRFDLHAGRVCAHEIQMRHAFCWNDFAQKVAQDSCEVISDVEIVEALNVEGVECTLEQARACSEDELWRMQGGFRCLRCDGKALRWKRCLSCGLRTCLACVVYQDLVFDTKTCGNCGNETK